MADFVNGKVRIYKRNINRKLKDGKNKSYTSIQHQVIMDKNDLLVDGQEVAVLPVHSYHVMVESLKNESKEHKEVDERYIKLQQQYEDLVKELQRARNTKDHTQERIRIYASS